MKSLITFIYFALLSSYAISQNKIVNVDLEVDGKRVSYNNASVKFIYDHDTLTAKIDSAVNIPALVFRKNATVIFNFNKYILQFDSIPVSVNDLHPRWIIGIDSKPFDKKKFWQIKSWKKVQVVYYLDNNYGRMYTVWRYRKSDVIK
jgi:hypothetical protein